MNTLDMFMCVDNGKYIAQGVQLDLTTQGDTRLEAFERFIGLLQVEMIDRNDSVEGIPEAPENIQYMAKHCPSFHRYHIDLDAVRESIEVMRQEGEAIINWQPISMRDDMQIKEKINEQ